LFKKALLYAEKNYNYVYILSALYGVVHPDEIIEPYDKTLIKMTVDERKSWYLMVENQLENLKRPFIFFTGKLYNEKFEGYKPLNGLGLGEQLQWFNRQLKKSKRKGFIK
jgi:hypothetical protein